MVIRLVENDENNNNVILTHSELIKQTVNQVANELLDIEDKIDTTVETVDILKIINCQYVLEQLVCDLAFLKS